MCTARRMYRGCSASYLFWSHGAEGVSATESPVGDDRHTRGPWVTGRVKALWSGVLSVSVDGNPERVEFQALSRPAFTYTGSDGIGEGKEG